MSIVNMHKMPRIEGNTNIVGNGNSINNNNRREERHTHHHHHGASSKSRDDMTGLVLGASIASITIAWFFVKNAELIYRDLQLGAIVSILPSLLALLMPLFLRTSNTKHTISGIYGVAIGAIGFLISFHAQAQLPQDLLDFNHREVNAWVFWQQLDHDQQWVVIGSLLGSVCIGGALLFNCVMGTFVSIDTLFGGKWDTLQRTLNPFRPGRGGIVGAILLVTATLFSTNIYFQLIDSMRAYPR